MFKRRRWLTLSLIGAIALRAAYVSYKSRKAASNSVAVKPWSNEL